MKTLLAVVACFLAITFSTDSCGQQVQPATESLSIESIFGSGRFETESFSLNWELEGSNFVRNKPSPTIADATDLVAVNAKTLQETILIPASRLVPQGKTKPLTIANHQWSADRNLALIFTNTRKVWRHHSRGDYWLMNRDANTLRQIGLDRPATSLMFAKLSPNGQSVAYVSEGEVYVENVESGGVTKITEKRTPEIVNGTSDWVYEEEFDLKDCFRWSPDSQKIAFWEFDTSEVGEFTMINNTDSLYPTVKKFKHTKPGQKNSAVSLNVVQLSSGATTWLHVPGDPRNNYLPRARWTGDSQLMLQQLNRDQNQNSVWLADANTGDTKLLFQDSDDAWVETCDYEIDVDGGKRFIWISERDGWRHVFLVDSSTGEMKLVTRCEFDAFEFLRATKEFVYFIASPEKPTDRYLYRTPLTGGEATRVTPTDCAGWNSYDISPDGTVALHTYSKFGQLPVADLIELPSHKIIRRVISNQPATQALGELVQVESEFLRVDVGEDTTLDAWIMKPANFDASKKYPLIVHVYGEPWGTTVTNKWGGDNYLWHRLLAERGYAVCSIDNRGTNVPRGREFRKTVYGRVGILPTRDQAVGVRAMLDRYDWLDAGRVGVWGWSGGGSMTLNAMFKHPDLYHTGVSVAPVPDMRYYDSIYQERYMGTPAKNPEGYRNGSPIHFAKNLKGNLMVIHGTGDDNCHYQTIELLINELVAQDKQFSLMAYPNRSHSINEGPNTSVHLRKLMTNYFLNHLPAGGK
jgi:dipeptidyl-peptidase-4